jgi:hypothetical protein
MTDAVPRPLDVVALLGDRPEAGLQRGQVGTVVDVQGRSALVEFADSTGRAIATVSLDADDVLILAYDVVAAE